MLISVLKIRKAQLDNKRGFHKAPSLLIVKDPGCQQHSFPNPACLLPCIRLFLLFTPPPHALATPSGLCCTTGHITRSVAIHLPACGHICICAGTTMPANINTARTSKAGSLGRNTWARWLPCTTVSPDLRLNRILVSQVEELYPGNDNSP